jgi:two-component system, OmpR family, response regulator
MREWARIVARHLLFQCRVTLWLWAVGARMDTANRDCSGYRVLVADGASVVRREVAAALVDLGLDVYEAGRGEEACEVISVVRIDALILDSALPAFGGLETIRVIRTFQRVPPFVLVAEEPTRELQVAALEWLATSVMPKPVDMTLLSDIVRTMLARAAF